MKKTWKYSTKKNEKKVNYKKQQKIEINLTTNKNK